MQDKSVEFYRIATLQHNEHRMSFISLAIPVITPTQSPNQKKHWQVRHGFTLVELLLVLGIIAALTGVGMGTQAWLQHKQDLAKAHAEMQVMALGLEKFKSVYGDYPWIRFKQTPVGSSLAPQKLTAARLFYQALTGRAKLVVKQDPQGTSIPQIFTYALQDIPSNSAISHKPSAVFIDPSKITAYDGEFFDDDPNFNAGLAFFIDPWGNAYEYFYIKSGTPQPKHAFEHWESQRFVLLSLGADGAHDVSSPAIAKMLSRGTAINTPTDYFETVSDGMHKNADNILYSLNY